MRSTRKIYEHLIKLLDRVWPNAESRQIARLLLEDQFGWELSGILADKNVEISENQKNLLEQRIERLLQHEPVQYVLGKTHFLNRTFLVDRNVLIPRPETEELVMLIRQENKLLNPAVLDIGTGSGCIAVSLALEIPNAVVTAWDIKPEILEVAGNNAKNLHAKVNFQQQNIFEADQFDGQFDIIVSNPPYVRESEKFEMQRNVLDFEPHLALFVSDQYPLIFYRSIGDFASRALPKGGRLYFEINEHFGLAIKDLLKPLGFDIRLQSDIHGKARMISAVKA